MAERKRAQIQFSGIDTATPDEVVADGKCSTLHNLRNTQSSWQNVHNFVKTHNLTHSPYEIIYSHPASPDNHYIGKTNSAYSYYQFVNEDADNYAWPTSIYNNLLFRKDQSPAVGDYLLCRVNNGHSTIIKQSPWKIASKNGINYFGYTRVEAFLYEWWDQENYFYTLGDTVNVGDYVYNGNWVPIGRILFFDGTALEYTTDLGNDTFTRGKKDEQQDSPDNPQQDDVQEGEEYEDGYYIGEEPDNTDEQDYTDPEDEECVPEDDADFYDPYDGYADNFDYDIFSKHILKEPNNKGNIVRIGGTGSYFEINANVQPEHLYAFYEIVPDRKDFVDITIGEDGSVVNEQLLFSYDTENTNVEIHHFGKILICNNITDKSIKYFQWDTDHYNLYNLSAENNIAVECKRKWDTYSFSENTNVKMCEDGGIHRHDYIAKNDFGVTEDIVTDDENHAYTFGFHSENIMVGLETNRVDNGTVIDYDPSHAWKLAKIINTHNLIRGCFGMFVAMRMKDGSILYHTLPQLYSSVESDTEPCGMIRRREKKQVESYTLHGTAIKSNIETRSKTSGKWKVIKNAFWNVMQTSAVPQLCRMVNFPTKIECHLDKSLIEDIVVYTTRGYDYLVCNEHSITATDVDFWNDPYYQAKVIKVEDMTYDHDRDIYSYSFVIDYSIFKNVETNPVFTAVQSNNDLYWLNCREYNNRLHIWNISTKLPTVSYKEKLLLNGLFINYKDVIVEYFINDSKYYKSYSVEEFATLCGNSSIFTDSGVTYLILPNRVNNIYLGKKSNNTANGYYIFTTLTPKFIPQFNISVVYNQLNTKEKHQAYTFFNNSGDDIYSYQTYLVKLFDSIHLSIDIEGTSATNFVLSNVTDIYQPNRMQVSAPNNCFVFPYANSYYIGSGTNSIVAVNSGAIEMSDSKFGEFPLYIFSTEGIFSMQSGSGDVVYANVIPISYDKAICDTTLAVNGSILFITKRGLEYLTRGGSKVISLSINSIDNSTPPIFGNCKMVFIPEHNELLIVGNGNNWAYLYSFNSAIWATRDVPAGTILNNYEVVSANGIYDLQTEQTEFSPLPFSIVTRPIKLGSDELKRLEVMILRHRSFVGNAISFEAMASVDKQNYITIRGGVTKPITTDVVLHRTPMSGVYHIFKISCEQPQAPSAIIGIELEYYFRFLHRLR